MHTLLFKTDQFNLMEEKTHSIKPGCYGEDLTSWLKPQLEQEKIKVNDIYQEDWGWEMLCTDNQQEYYIGVSGISDTDTSHWGEWRIMFTRRQGFMNALLGKNKINSKERITIVIKSILENAQFTEIICSEEA